MHRPVYATPVRSRWTSVFVVMGLLAGLAVGALIFYRSNREQPATAVVQDTFGAVSPESTPSSVTPAPKADVRSAPAKRSRVRPQRNPRATAAADFTPPVLLSPPGTTAPKVHMVNAQPQTQPVIPPAVVTTPRARRGRAVQDPGTDYASMPGPAPGDSSASQQNAAQNTAPAAPPASDSSRPQLIRHPVSDAGSPTGDMTSRPTLARQANPGAGAYAGPTSGTATWTGHLGKDETLTITGGTPSKGILAGAGLPGVPVRITVDEKNLGFTQMPGASNGYRTLVIQSHANHDKITVHWSVL